MIKVLVIEDSALMRKYLKEILSPARGFETYTARNGQDGLEQLRVINPDVITLDINMPVMDGMTCLSHIMTENPKPVIMVSSLTEAGAAVTLEAMNLGAVDYLAKPGGTVSLNLKDVEDQIIAKVKAASKARIRRSSGLSQRLRQQRENDVAKAKTAAPSRPTTISRVAAGAKASDATGLVLIGVSTGGPGTLEDILPLLPASFPWPVLVCQHMPGSFTGVFAQRMNGICALTVQEVSKPTQIQAGNIYIAKGDADMVLVNRPTGLHATSVPSDKSLWHPSVDRMVASALEHVKAHNLIGVQLTGMGYDGAEHMARIKQGGGKTIAESEASCVVFGMPKELIERGGASIVLPSESIAEQLLKWV
ncbi:MAG: chemotaxis-specific protein-glutamate methyltransferase CheB [Thiotrichales bacterium]|jgi:two-component system chemotaxis response regulator CheB|nr:chemotaxis-specific protein-glutamate methyltransferase CheB [Thiotrichales bacterium]